MKSKKESDIIEKEAINFTSIQNVDFNILYKVLNHPMCRLPLKNIFIDQVIKMFEEKAESKAIIERAIIEKAHKGEELMLNSRDIQIKTNTENDDTQDRSEAEKEADKISRELNKLLINAKKKIKEHDNAIKIVATSKKDIDEINSKLKKEKEILDKAEKEIQDSKKNEIDAKKSAEEAGKKEKEARERAEEQSKLEAEALEKIKPPLPKAQLQLFETDAKNAKAAQEKENKEAEKQKKAVEENKKKIRKERERREKARKDFDKAHSIIENYENDFEIANEALKEAEEKEKEAGKNEEEARMKFQDTCNKYLEDVKRNFAEKYIPLLSYVDFSAASLDQLRSLSKYDEDNIYFDLNYFLKMRESELNYNQKKSYIRNIQQDLISNSLKFQQENDDFLNYMQTKREEIEQNKIKLLNLKDELKQNEKDLVACQNENAILKQQAHLTNVSNPIEALDELSDVLDDETKTIENDIIKYQNQIRNQNENIEKIEKIRQAKEQYKQVAQKYSELRNRYNEASRSIAISSAKLDDLEKKFNNAK